MAGGKESESVPKRAAETIRNWSIAGALVGVVLMLANMTIGATIFEAGAVGAIGGESAKKMMGSKKE